MTKLLIMPGLGDSGKTHWQNFWLKKYPNAIKLNQNNWDQPILADWLDTMHKSIVVASENDPYISIERAMYLANAWGSAFVSVGLKGHINSDSNLEYWQEGQEILKRLVSPIDMANGQAI